MMEKINLEDPIMDPSLNTNLDQLKVIGFTHQNNLQPYIHLKSSQKIECTPTPGKGCDFIDPDLCIINMPEELDFKKV